MTITIEAIYEDGVLKPTKPLALKEHEKVEIVIRTPAAIQAAVEAVHRSYGLLGWKGDHETLERILAEIEEQEE